MKRKIDCINELKSLGLNTLEVREFKASEISGMVSYANALLRRYGSFNVRTDTNYDGLNFNLPFIKNASLSDLDNLVKTHCDRITYLIQQGIDDNNLVFNGVLRVYDDFVIGEINDVTKSSLRTAMKDASKIKRIVNPGRDFIFRKIKNDLLKINFDGWIELSAYNDGRVIYWQARPEKLNEHVKTQFFSSFRR